MSKILRKIGKKKRITGKKNRWEKSKIGSALISLVVNGHKTDFVRPGHIY